MNKYIANRQVKEAMETLTKVKPLVTSAHKNGFLVHRLSAELLQRQPNMRLVERLVEGVEGRSLLLLNVTSQCCSRGYYDVAMRVLNKLFPKDAVVRSNLTADKLLDCYERILRCRLKDLDGDSWRSLWNSYVGFCMTCAQLSRVTSFVLPENNDLPVEIRVEMELQKALAMLSKPPNNSRQLAEVEKLAGHMGMERDSVILYLRLLKCSAMAQKKEITENEEMYSALEFY